MKRILIVLIVFQTFSYAQSIKELKTENESLKNKITLLNKNNGVLKTKTKKDSISIADLEQSLLSCNNEKVNFEKITKESELNDFLISKKPTIFTTDFKDFQNIPNDLKYDYDQISKINELWKFNQLKIEDVLKNIEKMVEITKYLEKNYYRQAFTDQQKTERYDKILIKSLKFVNDYLAIKEIDIYAKEKKTKSIYENLKLKYKQPIQTAYLNKIIDEINKLP